MTMLSEKLKASQQGSPKIANIEQFVKKLKAEQCAFLCTNWDTFLEYTLHRVLDITNFDYGCHAIKATFNSTSEAVTELPSTQGGNAQIVKMHGSTNWLYCDRCRHVFWFPPDVASLNQLAGQILKDSDRKRIGAGDGGLLGWKCSRCGASPLGTRLATFSYVKALDFPMYQRSWLKAAELLEAATTWAFIGYSLPAADYELKYLLKRVQASRLAKPPMLVAVTGNPGAEESLENYKRFFGSDRIVAGENFFMNGLDEAAIDKLTEMSA